MNIFGGIGLIAAIRNYRKLKSKLQALEEKRETLQAAVLTYDEYKARRQEEWEEYYVNSGMEERDYQERLKREQDEIDNVNNPEDLEVTSVLKIANLVGNMYRAKISLVFSNVSADKTYKIQPGVSVNAYVGEYFNTPVASGETAADKEITIIPGQTVEIGLEKGVYRKTEAVNAAEQAILEYCGKKLITSCPKVNVPGVESADINFSWQYTKAVSNAEVAASEIMTAQYRQKPGVLRYCKELSLVGE